MAGSPTSLSEKHISPDHESTSLSSGTPAHFFA
jgi:hypothetical protein